MTKFNLVEGVTKGRLRKKGTHIGLPVGTILTLKKNDHTDIMIWGNDWGDEWYLSDQRFDRDNYSIEILNNGNPLPEIVGGVTKARVIANHLNHNFPIGAIVVNCSQKNGTKAWSGIDKSGKEDWWYCLDWFDETPDLEPVVEPVPEPATASEVTFKVRRLKYGFVLSVNGEEVLATSSWNLIFEEMEGAVRGLTHK